MKVFFSLSVLTFFVAMQCLGQQKQKVDTLFFEDFNSSSLDRGKWNVEVTGQTVNDEQQAYVDSSSVLYIVHGKDAAGAANGALVIKAVYHPGYISKEQKKYDFISGRINTRHKMEFTHGSASARMKIASGSEIGRAHV